MYGLMRTAAVVLASTLVASAHPLDSTTNTDDILPQAFIDLDVTKVIEDVLIPRTLLSFEVAEAQSSCGRSNITLDGNALDEDENGVGAGTIVTKHGTKVGAEWRYSCVQVDNRQHFERVLNFEIFEIDGYHIHNLKFSVQFQQIAPTGVSIVDGAFAVIRVPTSTTERLSSASTRGKPFNLQSELYELEVLNARLARIEFEIAAKEFFISATFPESGLKLSPSMSDCSDIKCFAATLWGNFKSLISGSHYDGFHRDHQGMIIIPPSVPEDMAPPVNVDVPGQHALTLQGSKNTIRPILDATVQQAQSPIVLTSSTDSNADDAPHREAPYREQEHAWRPSTTPLTADPVKTLMVAGPALLLLVAVIFVIRAACTEKARQRRRARCAARKEWREKREARLQAIKRTFANMCGWIHARITRKQNGGDDIEKVAAIQDDLTASAAGKQQPHHVGHEECQINVARLSWAPEHAGNDTVGDCHRTQREPESDEESTTMEQDLAHFRAVAGVVENLFTFSNNENTTTTAHLGLQINTNIIDRLRDVTTRPRFVWPLRSRSNSESYSGPPSPTSSVPSYTSSDETLPSYESSANSFVGWDQ